jgi:hypothetical protein
MCNAGQRARGALLKFVFFSPFWTFSVIVKAERWGTSLTFLNVVTVCSMPIRQ